MLPEAQIDFLFITPRSVYVIRVNCFQDTSTLITDTETTKLYDIKAGNFLQYSSLTSLINASKPVLVSEFPGNYWEEYMTAIYGICKWKSEFVFFFVLLMEAIEEVISVFWLCCRQKIDRVMG